MITDWVDSDTPKGNNPNTLPKEPKLDKLPTVKVPKNGIAVSGDLTLDRGLTLDGLFPERVPAGAAIRVVASLPDGATQPLLWLYEYKDSYQHPFLFRNSVNLPAGTVIRGIPSDARMILIPGKAKRSK